MKKVNIISHTESGKDKILLNVDDSIDNIRDAYDRAVIDMEEEDFISALNDPDEDLILEWDNEKS